MDVTVVRYRTKPDRADENQTLIEKVFAELHAAEPAGLEYTSYRLADGVSFVHVASIDTERRHESAHCGAGIRRLRARDRRPVRRSAGRTDATVVGSYRCLATERP